MEDILNQPKYSQGDRLGVWEIAKVNYRGEQFGYVYELKRFEGKKKVTTTCTEKVLEQFFNQTESA